MKSIPDAKEYHDPERKSAYAKESPNYKQSMPGFNQPQREAKQFEADNSYFMNT